MSDARRRPFEGPTRLRRTAPFALVTLIAFAAAALDPRSAHPAALLGALAVTAAIAAAVAFVPWSRLPVAAQAAPAILYFFVIILLREGNGGNASGYAPLVLIPVLWLVVYGGRAELMAAVAGAAVTLFAPLVLRPELAHAGDWRRAILSTVVAALAGLLLQRLLTDLLGRLEAERRDRGRQLIEAQEEERRRVARDLHDEVGQDLTALILQLERLARSTTDPRSAAALEDAREDARASLGDVRQIARRLRPEALDDLGLSNAVAALAGRVAAQSERRVVPVVEGLLPPLPKQAELAIYRVAQEGITNALRHGAPSEVVVGLAGGPGEVVLTVSDDGRGIAGGATTGSGVRGMRERADYIGGRLRLRRRPEGGTELRLAVPVAAAKDET